MSKRITISRDVVFLEDEGWNWNSQVKETDIGSFSINLGEFANRGLKDIEFGMETEKNTKDVSTEQETDVSGTNDEVIEILDNEEEEQQEQPQLRHSTRTRPAPEYMSDYILLAEAEGELLLMDMND